MAFIAVTNTFTNGTTADATEVNQNFQDIVSGLSDGSKNLTISAITAGSTATFNSAVSLGASTANDITWNGSLASSIPIKTTYTYDIGTATIGLRSIYLGDNTAAARSTRVIGATVASSWTLTLPTGVGTDGYGLITNGSGASSWQPFSGISNIGLTATVSANALTIALKTAAGTDASATDPIYVSFRSATLTTGTPVLRKVTGALSTVISSGSTLGSTSANANWVYVYLIDNAGTLELAYAATKVADEGSVITTTTEGGAGAADSKTTIYSTTGRSNVACRLIGRVKSTQATAGTWATAPSEISLWPFTIGLKVNVHSVNTPNGYGSTNTQVRKYAVVVEAIGTAITYTSSATNGDSWTINEDGWYIASVNDVRSSGAPTCTIWRNSTTVTSAGATLIVAGQGGAANLSCCVTNMFYGYAGDIVRTGQSAATLDGTTTSENFKIMKIEF